MKELVVLHSSCESNTLSNFEESSHLYIKHNAYAQNIVQRIGYYARNIDWFKPV